MENNINNDSMLKKLIENYYNFVKDISLSSNKLNGYLHLISGSGGVQLRCKEENNELYILIPVHICEAPDDWFDSLEIVKDKDKDEEWIKVPKDKERLYKLFELMFYHFNL